MSLFGSLITGVSALGAQAQSLGMVANNIANVSTVGYKRREAAFQSLVTSGSNSARYTPGSVLARTIQRIDGQGALQQTNATTDMAISGNGFFVVQRSASGLQESLFTRAGSFSEDSNGYLRNTAGFYLKGWRLDDDGGLPAGRDDISSLETVNVSLLGGLTSATTKAELNLNLDASEEKSVFPVPSGQVADFSRTLRVFDSLGAGQDVEFQFTHHDSPTSSTTSNVTSVVMTGATLMTAITGVDVGETINVSVGGVSATAPYAITATSTVQDFVNFVNNDTNLRDVATAEFSNGQVKVIARNFGDVATVTSGTQIGGVSAVAAFGFTTQAAYSATTGVNGTGLTAGTLLNTIGTITNGNQITTTVGAGSTTFAIGAGSTVQDFIDDINTNLTGLARAELTSTGSIRILSLDTANTVAVSDTSGTAATQLGFTATANTVPTQPTIFPDDGLTSTPTTASWWQLSLVNLATNTVLASGSINFGSNGTLNGNSDLNGLQSIQLSSINWGNGSALQDINFNISGLTQFSGEYNVTSVTQNGAELGLRTGVSIDRDGIVSARFSNGQTSALFKLPLATFTSPNSLSEQTGNAYTQTSDSGGYNLREAGSGGAGLVESSALESSNVDIADEFTKMIVTQRAYSAGTKVIRTADDMTEELLRLR